MAKTKKSPADMNKIYSLYSCLYTTLLGVTLCLQETLRGRFLFLYTRGCRIANKSFASPANTKEV